MADRYDDRRFIRWSKDVKERDDFTCQICNKQGVTLHSHHLNSFDMFVNERYDIDNGLTLCSSCHMMFHRIFGKGANTKFQFEEFKKSISLLQKVLAKIDNNLIVEPNKVE